MQKISDNFNINIDIQDVNTNEPQELFYIYKSIFNLSKKPLLNISLFKLPNGKSLLMLDVHHIIFDGASLNNFIQELSDIYNKKALPDIDISYKDFAIWENQNLENDIFKDSKEFWIEQLQGDLPVLNLSTNSRPAKKSYDGNTYITSIGEALKNKIYDFSKSHNITPYMLMLSCYYILLHKYSEQEDIIIGTPSSGRIYKELEPLIRYVCK